MRIKIFLVESSEDPICPVCGSPLKYRDHVPRIVKTRGGDVFDSMTASEMVEEIEQYVSEE